MRRNLAVAVLLCAAIGCAPGTQDTKPIVIRLNDGTAGAEQPRRLGNLVVKDANGVTRTMNATDNAGVLTSHSIVDEIPAIEGQGTAGSPSGGLVTVQGTPSGTAIPVSVSGLPLPGGAATESTLGTLATQATVATLATESSLSTLTGAVSSGTVKVTGAGAAGAAVTGNPVQVGGSDGTNLRAFKLDSSGYLGVNIISGAGSGGTAMTDDAAFTPATTSITPAGATFDDVSPDSVNEGDGGAVRMSGNRNLYTTIRDAAGNERGINVDAAGAIGVNILSGAGSGGTAMTDDAAFTPGSTSITPMGATFDDVAPDSVNEGDGMVLRGSANRNLYVTLRDAAGNERGLNIDAAGGMGVNVVSALPAGTANIGDVDVLTLPALPAGTNAIGKLAANAGVNIGTVAISALVPGIGATDLGKAEDDALISGDVGVLGLAVRDDSLSADAADGDYVPLKVDGSNRLYTLAVGAGTPGSASGGVMTVQGSASGTAIPVSLTASALNIGDVDVLTLPALPAGSNNIGDVDVVTLPALAAGTNNIGDVDVLTLPALAAGTNAIGKLAANSGVDIGDVDVTTVVPGTTATSLGKAEDAGHSDADTGVFALTVRKDTAASTAGSTNDYAALTTDSVGRLRSLGTPDAVGSTSYWSAQSSAATLTGSAVDTTFYRQFCWTFSLANTTTPVGSIEIDGSVDGTDWYPIYIDANKAGHIINGTAQSFAGGSTLAVSSPAGTVKYGGCVEAVFPSTRIVYNRTSGGAVSTINASYSLRAN